MPAADPLHNDDPVHVRLARHARGIALFVAVGAAAGLTGLFPDEVAWWHVPALFLGVSVAIAATYARFGSESRRDTQLRAFVQAGGLAACTYITGWGFALVVVHLFSVADHVNESGSAATRRALAWSVAVTVVGQLGIQASVVPSAVPVPMTAHVIAACSLPLVVLVAGRLRNAATEREKALELLTASEARFRALVEDASDVILVLQDDTLTYASPSIERVLGFPDGASFDGHYLDLVDPDDRERAEQALHGLTDDASSSWLVEVRVRRGDGSWLPVEVSHRDLRDDPHVAGIVLVLRDVSERHELEAEIEHRSLHDELTGLPNRSMLGRKVSGFVARATGDAVKGGLVVLSCDGVARTNETIGHEAGDAALVAAAERLEAARPPGAVVARLGGATFGVLVPSARDAGALTMLARELRDVLSDPDLAPGWGDVLAPSVGVAMRDPSMTARELLRSADIALRIAQARSDGSSSEIVVFDESMHSDLVERMELERDLRDADLDAELVVVLQPLYAVEGASIPEGGRIVGAEALVRWQHPQRGLLGPGEFIPIAEARGLIAGVGEVVLRKALAQLAAWDAGHGELMDYVSVNVSMRQFAGGDLVDLVRTELAEQGLEPGRLLLELTETALAADPEAIIPQLEALSTMGVRLAVDDFGTGFSSFDYLQRFPLDVLKIDRSFVSEVATPGRRPELLAGLVDLARSLGLATVAEGVELAEDLDLCAELGVDIAQGFGLARPLSGTDLLDLLLAQQAADHGVDAVPRAA